MRDGGKGPAFLMGLFTDHETIRKLRPGGGRPLSPVTELANEVRTHVFTTSVSPTTSTRPSKSGC